MSNNFIFSLAFGVLVGNWLIAPLFTGKSHADGFLIGLVAAVLIVFFMTVIRHGLNRNQGE